MQNSHFNNSSNSEIESKSAGIEKLSKDMKLKQDESLILDQLNGLLKIEKFYLNENEKLQNIQQPMKIKKDQLLEYKQQLVDINCPELNADIEETDAKLRDVHANIYILEKKIENLKDRVKTEMIEYAKKYISQSDMAPQIADILKKHGITSSTLANSPVIRLLKRPADEKSAFVVNKPLLGPKKPKNHHQALLAIKEEHCMRSQLLWEEQKSLLDYIIDLENRGDFAEEWEDAQAQLKASYEQSDIETENVKLEVDQYIAQYMEKKDFNQNILQLIDDIFPYNTEVFFQPKQTVDEPMPVLEPEEQEVDEEEYINVVDDDDQAFQVPQEQEDVPLPVDDCVAHLKEMLISSEQEIRSHDKYKQKLRRRHEAAKYDKLGDLDQNYRRMFTTEQIRYRMTRDTKNKLNSFKSHLRVTNIKHKLEMIDYIEKNLTPDQLTDEILDLLENKSIDSKCENPETIAYGKQIQDLQILIETEDELNRKVSEILDAIAEENDLMDEELIMNCNVEKAREYEQSVARKEIDSDIILKEIELARRIYAAKYIAPKNHDRFVSDADLPSLLGKLVAHARNRRRLDNGKNLENRLKQLTDDLSKEFDQVISSIQSTSTSVNFSGRFDTFVPPKNEQIVVQFVGAEDANAVVNGEQPDNNA